MLSECIRRYFFPSRAKETKKQKKIIITPDLRLGCQGLFMRGFPSPANTCRPTKRSSPSQVRKKKILVPRVLPPPPKKKFFVGYLSLLGSNLTVIRGYLIGEPLFICLTMESLWDVNRDVSTTISASLHQAMRSFAYVSLIAPAGGVRHDSQRFMGKTVMCLISIVTRSSSHLVREMRAVKITAVCSSRNLFQNPPQ